MGWFSGWTGLAAWIGAALLLLAPYWLGPIQVRSALRHPAEPTFELYDPPRHAAPPEAVAYVDQAAQALGGLGFTGATRLVEATWTPAATALVTIAEHRQMQDVAMAAALYTTRRPHVVKSRYVEFVAKWSNGRQPVANDNAAPPIYPPVRHRILTQFPGLSDPARLFRIHQVLATRSAPAAKAALPDEWAPVSRLSAAMLESVREQIAAGYTYFDPAIRRYRPTWKGALLMCWKLLPPTRTIRRARLRHRAAALLRELNA